MSNENETPFEDVRGQRIFVNSTIMWVNHTSSRLSFNEGIVESSNHDTVFARRNTDGKISALKSLKNIIVLHV